MHAKGLTMRTILAHAHRATWLPAVAVALTLLPSRVRAQTDYYNTDAGRPIQVEDAYPVERRAVELQLAPLRLERARGGIYAWGIEPEIAVGLLPRTQLEIGFPLAHVDGGQHGRATGLAGIELSALHNLNVETRLPALGVVAEVLLPAGNLAPEQAYASVKGIATKTLPWARFHLNGRYTFGDDLTHAEADAEASELSRWMGGIAIDRTLPLQSLLVTAEVVARQPLAPAEKVLWESAVGTRIQLSPRVATDAGVGYRFTRGHEGWYATFGAAVALGLPWSPRR
jgi:hypothetical protein